MLDSAGFRPIAFSAMELFCHVSLGFSTLEPCHPVLCSCLSNVNCSAFASVTLERRQPCSRDGMAYKACNCTLGWAFFALSVVTLSQQRVENILFAVLFLSFCVKTVGRRGRWYWRNAALSDERVVQ